jgi:predicted negative regulator of RcsB-dependent stress response
MAYDLEEQEQLDEFKAWWKKNGKIATGLILISIIAYAAWQGYHYVQDKKAVEASTLFQTLITTDTTKLDSIKSQATILTTNYAGTPYAGRAAVFAAKTSAENKDSKTAKSQLEWASANATESSVKAIANLQLAGLLFEDKNYDGALKSLASITDKGFDGLKEDLKGDIYLAQGKKVDAIKAYKNALNELDAQGKMQVYTRQKLESLGE